MPAEPRWAPDSSPAEQALWRWAVEQLPGEVVVLPQVALALGSGGRVEEAELDLVLLDGSHGITVVEVKGGTLTYDAARAVWRRRESGAREVRDPVQQAKRGRSHLRRALASLGIPNEAIALRWVVATPDCRLDAPGEPVLSEAQLWDALAADQLRVLYRRSCGPLQAGEQPLGEYRTQQIAAALRGRTREGRASLAAEIDAHEDEVRVHTESHRNVLRQFAANPFVLVRGSAGTGKTVLALEAACQYASLGSRLLLTCWNVLLGEHLRESLRERLRAIGSALADSVTDDPSGRIVVAHLGELARHGTTSQPNDDEHRWYHEELPAGLRPEVLGEFDVVVLDEAQDLSELWVLALSQLVARNGRWYAFADSQQDLFHANAALPDFLDVQHELRENFRNSGAIAEFAREFGELELDCVTSEGPPVRFVAADGSSIVNATLAAARDVQKSERIPGSDIAVLWLFHNPHKGATATLGDAVRAGERLETNAASFKGLERPVVVLGLDVDPTKKDRVEELRRSIYVGATRARSLLVIVGDPECVAESGLQHLGERLAATRPRALDLPPVHTQHPPRGDRTPKGEAHD